MPRVCVSYEAVSEQELQRAVEADVRQRRNARPSWLGRGRPTAQKAVVTLVRGVQAPKPTEQCGRIVRKIAGKRRDFGLAVEAIAAERFAGERHAGDGGQLIAP